MYGRLGEGRPVERGEKMEYLPGKMLLAADGSEDSTLALRTSVELARGIGAELHVVYVALVSPWVYPVSLSGSERKKIEREQRGILDGLVEEAKSSGVGAVGSHFRVGRRADDEIITLAEELGVGMIVVGSRGKSTLERALMGSDSESVVRYARCPVLVVREAG